MQVLCALVSASSQRQAWLWEAGVLPAVQRLTLDRDAASREACFHTGGSLTSPAPASRRQVPALNQFRNRHKEPWKSGVTKVPSETLILFFEVAPGLMRSSSMAWALDSLDKSLCHWVVSWHTALITFPGRSQGWKQRIVPWPSLPAAGGRSAPEDDV